MTQSSATELLDRVVNASGVLLRVQCLHPDGMNAAAILLTFDVGRLLLCVRPEVPGLTALGLEKPEDVPGGLVEAGEDDPWWMVLGNALCGVESRGADGSAVRLQFRKVDENPRFITFAARGAGVGVLLEPV